MTQQISTPDLSLGDSDPVIALVKARLNVFPDDEFFNDHLAQKLRGFQQVRGLFPDGILTDSVLVELGISRES